MAAIEGRDVLLRAAEVVSISSMEIVAESTLGAGDFAPTHGRGKLGQRPEGSNGDLEAYDHLAGRDVRCCDAQVWQILGQPRGGNTT